MRMQSFANNVHILSLGRTAVDSEGAGRKSSPDIRSGELLG
ncbi:hypothetical protein P5646_20210 [Bacillus velezensis]